MTKNSEQHHFLSKDMVNGAEWNHAMSVSKKFIAKYLRNMQCGDAISESIFGMPPEQHFVGEAFIKLYSGKWRWDENKLVSTQITKIARSDIHHYLKKYKAIDRIPIIELADWMADRLPEEVENLDVLYEIVARAAGNDKSLLEYQDAVRRCADYNDIAVFLNIPLSEVYQRQRRLLRKVENDRGQT